MSETGSDLDSILGLVLVSITKVLLFVVGDQEKLVVAVFDQACDLAWADDGA